MKKLIKLFLVCVLLMSTLSVSAFAETSSIKEKYQSDAYLTLEEIRVLTEYYITTNLSYETTIQLYASDEILPLYDFDGVFISYAIPLEDELQTLQGYVIVDARKNGYGICESSLDIKKAVEIFGHSKKDILIYKYPSVILVSTDVEEYIANISNDPIKYKGIKLKSLPEAKNYDMEGTMKLMEDEISTHDRSVALANEIFELSGNPSATFVPVTNGSTTYYGGNQSWFTTSDQQNRGCGTTAAANIAWHLDKYGYSGFSKLYSYSSISKANFTKHMNEVIKYVNPTIIGIPSTNTFETKFKEFASSRGVSLLAHKLITNYDLGTTSQFIKSGLSNNSPVAMLQFSDADYPDFNLHWVTITRYFRNTTTDDRFIKVSSWGEPYTLNLKLLVDLFPNDYIWFN